MKDLVPSLPQSLPQRPILLSSPTAEVLPEILGEGGIRLYNYWKMIRKHLKLIFMVLFGTVLVAAVSIFTITPLYTAETTLLIERQAPQVLNIQAIFAEPLIPDEYDYYKTQYEILNSRSLAALVIRDQGLEENGHLAIGEERKGLPVELLITVKGWIGRQLESFFPPASEPLENYEINPKVIDAYLDHLGIDPIPRTRLVKISFKSPDPKISARIANAHVQAYIHQGLQFRTQVSEGGSHFLEEKLTELKERVEKSEAALNAYRRKKGILSIDEKENVVVDRLIELNKLLTGAEADTIGLEAQVRLIRKGQYDSLPAVINSTLIQALKEQFSRLEGEKASLSMQFKPDYPRLAQLGAQVKEAWDRLQKSIQEVVEGINSAYLAAETKEKELRTKVENQKATALNLKNDSVEYAILAREVDTNHQLYDSVLQRIKEMQVAAEFHASNISIVDKAVPPLKPSYPKKGFGLLLSCFAGLIGGMGFTFFLEYFDNTLQTPEEVGRYLQLPNLGIVPDLHDFNRGQYFNSRKSPALPQLPSTTTLAKELVLSHHSLSQVTEAYRMLRTAILLSRAGKPPKVILLTSSMHMEGKTVTALNTAIVFAQMGAKVLLIDADLRRAGCHDMLGMRNGFGLTEVLSGQAEVDEVIRPVARNLFSFLNSGSIPPNPAELLGSKKMQDILTILRERYDYILVDSPPVMLVTDATLLSTMTDGVVLVINSQATPHYVVKEACSRLNYARARILGTLLNKANINIGDYAYYCNGHS